MTYYSLKVWFSQQTGNRWTDRRYQVHYLLARRCFTINNKLFVYTCMNFIKKIWYKICSINRTSLNETRSVSNFLVCKWIQQISTVTQQISACRKHMMHTSDKRINKSQIPNPYPNPTAFQHKCSHSLFSWHFSFLPCSEFNFKSRSKAIPIQSWRRLDFQSLGGLPIYKWLNLTN